MFTIVINKKAIKFWKERGGEWTGFVILEYYQDGVFVFTGNRDGEAEQLIFI